MPPGGAPLPKAALAAGATAMGGMLYWVTRDANARQRAVPRSSDAPPASAPPAKELPFLGTSTDVSAANVPSFVLAATNLDAEQKLQIALCRRQAWVRAAQLGPTLALCGYSACVLTEAAGVAKLPRGSKTAVPLGLFVVGMSLGAYLGGREGKPMMNAALLSKPIEGMHVRRADRPPEEDALVAFAKSARDAGRAKA